MSFLATVAAIWFLISIGIEKKKIKRGGVIQIERPKISFHFKRMEKNNLQSVILESIQDFICFSVKQMWSIKNL